MLGGQEEGFPTNNIPDEVSAYEVLEKGLNDLSDLCDVVVDKFTSARDEYNATNQAS